MGGVLSYNLEWANDGISKYGLTNHHTVLEDGLISGKDCHCSYLFTTCKGLKKSLTLLCSYQQAPPSTAQSSTKVVSSKCLVVTSPCDRDTETHPSWKAN